MAWITSKLPGFIDFVFGARNKFFWSAFLFVVVNAIFDLITSKKFWPWTKKQGIKLLAYGTFIMIGNRIDDLAVNEMFDWNGSTQLLVCLGLIAKEFKILLVLFEKAGYGAPSVLIKRIADMETGDAKAVRTTDTTDQKIEQLRQELDRLLQSSGQTPTPPVAPFPTDPAQFQSETRKNIPPGGLS